MANRLPLLIGIAAFAVGVGCGVFSATQAHSEALVEGLALPLAPSSTLAASIVGYLLTPLVVFAMLIWDRIGQQVGLRDRNFALKPTYAVALQWIAGLGMLVGMWHALNIAFAVSGA